MSLDSTLSELMASSMIPTKINAQFPEINIATAPQFEALTVSINLSAFLPY
jgi:hypothetical protein